MIINEVDHPLIKHKLTVLRNKKTQPMEFREVAEELSILLAYKATQDLKLKDVDVETPLQKTKGKSVDDDIVLIPILRAGMGMVNPLLKIIPDASVFHFGLYRNEKTLEAVEYYSKFPEDFSSSTVFILDPMFATGNSFKHALDAVFERNPKRVKFISLVSSPQACENLKDYPHEFELYTASIDEGLNEKGYIVPGLGDAGDRIYGTYPK